MKALRLALAAALLSQAGVLVGSAQLYAWASMLADGQTASDTFDGQHPCHVCITVQDAASSHELRPAAPPSLDWHLAAPAVAAFFSLPSLFPLEARQHPLDFFVSSDAPPPRALLS